MYGTITGDTSGQSAVYGDDAGTGTGGGGGVYGTSTNGSGVLAQSTRGSELYRNGTSKFTGAMSKPGGSFQIDHPLDPARKHLYHSSVESPT